MQRQECCWADGNTDRRGKSELDPPCPVTHWFQPLSSNWGKNLNQQLAVIFWITACSQLCGNRLWKAVSTVTASLSTKRGPKRNGFLTLMLNKNLTGLQKALPHSPGESRLLYTHTHTHWCPWFWNSNDIRKCYTQGVTVISRSCVAIVSDRKKKRTETYDKKKDVVESFGFRGLT